MEKKKRRIITLSTDFGALDGYVGIVKGVILSICDELNLVDLSHEIPAWNIPSAAWIIGNSYPHFPEGTVHLVVVDPGVGSKRRPLALQASGQFFVGPDNGIFSSILHAAPPDLKAFELTEQKYWRSEISTTFHARDLFAPVCGHLAAGLEISALGPELEPSSLVRLPLRELRVKQNRIEGSVAYVDHFGNLITNIKKDFVRDSVLCQVGKRSIGRIGQSYSSGEQGVPVAFVGSHGFLEIAVSQGRADEKLDAGLNTPVILFESNFASD